MADSAALVGSTASGGPATAPAQASPKKAKSAGSKKPRTKPAHPRTSEMVGSAIKSLKERGGSSLQAIKKYISANYKVDSEKLAPFIKKYLKAAVASGELVQTKGKGASGSFKLASSAKPEKAVAATPARRSAPAPKEKKLTKARKAPGKAAAGRKAAVKKPAEKKRPAAAPKPKKAPSKVKKATKVPTKKPKAPKPKKAAKPRASPKKAPPKKK